MNRLHLRQSALCILLLLNAFGTTGCAKRFGGYWPFGEDQTEALKKYGPAPVQRIQAMQERAKKLAKATPTEKESFAAEMAKQIQSETDFNIRLAIVEMLAKMDTPSSKMVLYSGLKDPETDIRVACCEAWGKQPSPEATRMLAETLSGDTDLDVRLAAAKALSHATDKDAVKALGSALEDSDPAVQYCAVASLKEVTGKDLGNDVKVWRELAQQPDPPVRTKALASRVWPLF